MAEENILASAINVGKEEIKGSIDGFHEDTSKVLNDDAASFYELFKDGGWFQQSFETLLGSMGLDTKAKTEDKKRPDKSEAEKFAEGNAVNPMFAPAAAAAKDENGPKVKTTGVTTKDLKILNETDGIGFVVLGLQLERIIEILEGAPSLGKKGKKKKGGGLLGGVGSFFSGLLKGAGAIAATAGALMLFAGATKMFESVNWPAALQGIVAFGLFVTGMMLIAKLAGKNMSTFKKFAQASLLMSASLAVFSIALLLTGCIMSGEPMQFFIFTIPGININAAVGGLALFGVFILAMAGIAKMMNNVKTDLIKFGLASMLMSGALVVFAFALKVTGSIIGGKTVESPDGKMKVGGVNMAAALGGLGLFVLFVAAFAGLGALFAGVAPMILMFTATSILMSVALVTFSFALYVVGALFDPSANEPGPDGKQPMHVKKEGLLPALLTMGLFMTGLIAVGAIAAIALIPIAAFTAAAVLASVGLTLLSLTMCLVGNVFSEGFTGGKDENGQPIGFLKVNTEGVFAGLAQMGLFLGAVALLGVPAALAVVGGAVVLAAAAVIFPACLLLTLSMGITALVGSIGDGEREITDDKGKKQTVSGSVAGIKNFFANAKIMFKEFGKLVLPAAGVVLASIAILPAAVAIFGTVALLAGAMGLITIAVKGGRMQTVDDEGKPNGGEQTQDAFDTKILGAFFSNVQVLMDGYGGLKTDSLKNAKKISKLISPFAKSVKQIAEAMIMVYDMAGEQEKFQNIDIMTLFDPFLKVVDSLVTTANKMESDSAKAYALVIASLEPITNTITSLLGIVDDAAVFDTDEGREKINSANRSINLIMLGDGTKANPGFIPAFNKMLENVKGCSQKTATAAAAMPAITESILKMTDIVDKASTIENIDLGITNTDKLTTFMVTMFKTLSTLLPGGLAGFGLKLWEGDPVKNLAKVKDMLESDSGLVETIKAVMPLAESMNTLGEMQKPFDPKISDNLKHTIETIGAIDKKKAGNAATLFTTFNTSLSAFAISPTPFNNLRTALTALTALIQSENPFTMLNNSIQLLKGGIQSLASDTEEVAKKVKKVTDNAIEAQKKLKAELETVNASMASSTASKDASSYNSIADLAALFLSWDDNGAVKVKPIDDKKDKKDNEKGTSNMFGVGGSI